MSDEAVPTQSLAALLAHLGRTGEGAAASADLSPAQAAALRYLGRANRLSRTVSALAAYQGTTRGTVSQTVKALERAGYLQRVRSDRDGRSARLDLTAAGRARLNRLGDDPLADALERLPSADRAALGQAVLRLAGQLADRGAGGFGTCPTCRHLESGCGAGPDYCRWAGQPLDASDRAALCVSYSPARGCPTPDTAANTAADDDAELRR
jgi:DNA-binding MarR family transcriptional regulator